MAKNESVDHKPRNYLRKKNSRDASTDSLHFPSNTTECRKCSSPPPVAVRDTLFKTLTAAIFAASASRTCGLS